MPKHCKVPLAFKAQPDWPTETWTAWVTEVAPEKRPSPKPQQVRVPPLTMVHVAARPESMAKPAVTAEAPETRPAPSLSPQQVAEPLASRAQNIKSPPEMSTGVLENDGGVVRPLADVPQHVTIPLLLREQEASIAVATFLTLPRPAGTVVEPDNPAPQQKTVVSDFTAQACSKPTLTCTALVTADAPDTIPFASSPQHTTR